jgi:hypothetical protein
MTGDDPEIEYLRAVEELFTTLRGVPHILSPQDVHLVREWWRDGVPLAAVGAGVGEVIDRKRGANDPDPVASLSYCRHAVRRAARRLSEQREGLSSDVPEGRAATVRRAVHNVASMLTAAADGCRASRAGTAAVIDSIATQVTAVADLEPAAVEENLFTLETALLEGCWRTLDAAERERITTSSERAAASSGAPESARGRAVRALRDQAVRRLLALPRLEV